MAYPDHFDSRIERKIIDRIINEALAKDWLISIYDGEDWSLGIPSRDREKITEQIAATEATILHFWYVREKVGWIAFIHGNDEDVIHDWGHAFPEFKPILDELAREWEEPAPPQHIMDAVHALEPRIYLPLLSMRAIVNTVIEALAEPTPRMLLAGSMVGWPKYKDSDAAARDVWKAMARNMQDGSAVVEEAFKVRAEERRMVDREMFNRPAPEAAPLIDALEWYADEVMAYSITQANEPRSAVHGDRGARARDALAKYRSPRAPK